MEVYRMDDYTKLEKIKAAQHLIRAALSLVKEATDSDDCLVVSHVVMPLKKLVAGRHTVKRFTLDDLIHETEHRLGAK
jgi:hypothetical protein